MIQDTQTIRYYQRLTDCLTDLWSRGYRLDDLRLYLDGYLSAFRHSSAISPHLINQLEEETSSFLFELTTQIQPDFQTW